jgi:hypothetical protein
VRQQQPPNPKAPCECPLCHWPERFEHKRGEYPSYKKSALFDDEICTDCEHDLWIFAM